MTRSDPPGAEPPLIRVLVGGPIHICKAYAMGPYLESLRAVRDASAGFDVRLVLADNTDDDGKFAHDLALTNPDVSVIRPSYDRNSPLPIHERISTSQEGLRREALADHRSWLSVECDVLAPANALGHMWAFADEHGLSAVQARYHDGFDPGFSTFAEEHGLSTAPVDTLAALGWILDEKPRTAGVLVDDDYNPDDGAFGPRRFQRKPFWLMGLSLLRGPALEVEIRYDLEQPWGYTDAFLRIDFEARAIRFGFDGAVEAKHLTQPGTFRGWAAILEDLQRTQRYIESME